MTKTERKLSDPLVDYLVESATDRIMQKLPFEGDNVAQAILEGGLTQLTSGVIRDPYNQRLWLQAVREIKEIAEAKPPSIEEITRAAALCIALGIVESAIAQSDLKQQTTSGG